VSTADWIDTLKRYGEVLGVISTAVGIVCCVLDIRFKWRQNQAKP
jgi:hypothetical protein